VVVLAALAGGVALGALAFAGGGSASTSAAAKRSVAKAKPRSSVSVSGGSLLDKGAAMSRILKLPGLGEFQAACGSGGRATTRLVLLPKMATTAVVVQADGAAPVATESRPVDGPNPGGPAGFQIWQAAPISAVEGPVATIWAAMQPHPPSGGCVVTVHALITITTGVGP